MPPSDMGPLEAVKPAGRFSGAIAKPVFVNGLLVKALLSPLLPLLLPLLDCVAVAVERRDKLQLLPARDQSAFIIHKQNLQLQARNILFTTFAFKKQEYELAIDSEPL